MLYQTTTNQTKINELKTILFFDYELMRPGKCIINLANLKTMFFWWFIWRNWICHRCKKLNAIVSKCSQNMLDKLVPEPFLKVENWAYLWINSLNFYALSFYCIPSRGLSKYIETKVQTIRFYLKLSFFKK